MELSFCIPTFNRASFIGACLESLVPQIGAGMEIVIVDGGSTDGTEDIVRGYLSRYPFIRYFKREKNFGVDEDILYVVEQAAGTYCWLLSDDDCVAPGSVEHVQGLLRRYPDLAGASVNYKAYDKTMSFEVHAVPAAGHAELHEDHLFETREASFSVLGIHFGFLSSQIVRRDLWQKAVALADPTLVKGSCWMLVYMLGRVLEQNARWLYIHRPCIQLRTGNDSFKARLGFYQRQVIAHISYRSVIDVLFGPRSPVCRKVMKILISDRMPRTLADTKAGGLSIGMQVKLLGLYTRLYWSYADYWGKVFPLFFVPCFVFKFAKRLYMRLRKVLEHSAPPQPGIVR